MLDTARRVVSARRVVQYQNEIGVLAHLWYNALTTAAGDADVGGAREGAGDSCSRWNTPNPRARPGPWRSWTPSSLGADMQARARAREPPPTLPGGRRPRQDAAARPAATLGKPDVAPAPSRRPYTRFGAAHVRGDRARRRVRGSSDPERPGDRPSDAAYLRARAPRAGRRDWLQLRRSISRYKTVLAGVGGPFNREAAGSRRWG